MKYFNNPIKKIRLLNSILHKTISKRPKLFLIGTPLHGNLGDQAIVAAELKYLADIAPEYNIVEIPSPFFSKLRPLLEYAIKPNNLILVHGGGFLGDTWQSEEDMFRDVIDSFPKNNIIVLPQTAYFSNTKNGREQLKKSQKIWQNHHHLTICCREKYSYAFVTKNFPSIKTILIPDTVLYLAPENDSDTRTTAVYCIRHDKEKIQIDTGTLDKATSQLQRLSTDTVVPYTVYPWERNKELKKKFSEFRHAKIVGTDRLHGMVFAYLTRTPCIIYNNANYKIDGAYAWLEECNYLLRGDVGLNEIKSIMQSSRQDKVTVNLATNFTPLTKLIKEQLLNNEPQ